MNNLSLELANRQTLILTFNPNREILCELRFREKDYQHNPKPSQYETSFILDLKQKQQVADFLTQK